MTDEKKPPEVLKDAHDVERIRAEFLPVMGRDNLAIILWYAFWRIILKVFSLSFVFACVATGFIYDLTAEKEAKVLESWYPWAFAVTAWLNLVARPQFKRLVEAFAKHWENKS